MHAGEQMLSSPERPAQKAADALSPGGKGTPRAGVATPGKLRIDEGSLANIEAWLARFQTTPPNPEWFASFGAAASSPSGICCEP